MKKLIAILCAAALLVAMMVPALAEEPAPADPSPAELNTEAISIEEVVADESVELASKNVKTTVSVKKANPAAYTNNKVASLVSSINNIAASTATTVNKDGEKVATKVESETVTNADGTKTITTTVETTNVETGETTVETVEETVEDTAAVNVTVKDVVTALADALPENTALTVSDDGSATLTIKAKDGGEDVVMKLDNYDFVSKFSDVAIEDDDEVVYSEDGSFVKATITIKDDVLSGIETEEDLASYKIMLIDPTTGEIQFLDLIMDEDGNITADFPFLGTFCLVQDLGEVEAE